MGIGRREVVAEVHEGEAELLVGLAWTELLWNGGSTAACARRRSGWSGGGVLRRQSEEKAKE